jgi:ATP-binding cassette subfamily B (MDR/TAP) protein 1
VSFAYPSRPDDVVLHNVNLKFPTGKHTAIVGPSGSGKSTIATLLTRLYDPTEGLISFDGDILTDLNVRSLRAFVSLVQQEPALLSRSILENIALGLVNSTALTFQSPKQILEGTCLSAIVAEGIDNPRMVAKHGQSIAELLDFVRRAAHLADADTFIQQLPQAYSTVIGYDGQRLSGGQKQRVAIARALVRDPRVLILDEATASLDSLSEHRVLKAINELKGSRTVISIAHRLSTIKNADNIIVLSSGEVVEQGTYDDLKSRSGIFSRMVASQSLEHSADDYDSQANSIDSIQIDSQNTLLNADSHRNSDDRQPRISFAGEELHSHAAESGGGKAELTASTQANLFSMDSNLSLWILIKSMGRYARPQLSWLVLATFAAVIVGLTFSSGGLIFGNTVGALTPCNTTINHILYIGKFFGGMLFMIACVEFLANFLSWSSFATVSERLVYTIRVLTFRSLVEKSVQWHQVTIQNPSETLSVITKDCAAIAGFSGSTMGTLFSILINFLVAIILSHIVAWKIAIVCLAMVPILLGSGILQLYSHSRFEEKSSKALTKAVGVAIETVTLFTTIATFSLHRNISESFSEALSAPRKDIVLGSIYANIWLAISNSIGFFVYAFAYWWGAHQVIKGENTQQQFFIILVAMLVSAQLWGQAFVLAPEVSRARSSASRIMSLINSTSNGDRCARDDALSQESGEAAQDIEKQAARVAVSPGNSQQGAAVSFRSVCFAYPSSPNTSVLENISFEVSPGQLCGLVGPSGAGKSTIIDLLQNIYNATSGSVEIDGVNVSHKDFRNEIAIVPQENALFSGTVRFNVGLGGRPSHNATNEDIEEACKLAGLHDTIIALPDGYETECGPNGSHLSGGQRRRLSIARALVRKPRLLILDESTSALDAQTEHALQEGLERVVRKSGITVIAITHRLHTVQKANIIMVIEGGKLAGSGTHEQLLQTSETYRFNAEQQMLK